MKLMLIGGGEIGRGLTPYETKEIDEEIVKLSGKDNPNVLFVGLASSFSDSYYDVVKNIYKNLGCTPVYLKKNNLIHNPDIVKQKFMDADIIYIGGGDTVKLLEKIEEYNLKHLFDEAMERDCVLAGTSAGAILLSQKGFSDAYILREEKDTYEMINGFNYFQYSITPHYHKDQQKTEELEKYLKDNKVICYGIENGTAIEVVDDKISVIKSLKDNNVYEVSYKDKLIEKVI